MPKMQERFSAPPRMADMLPMREQFAAQTAVASRSRTRGAASDSLFTSTSSMNRLRPICAGDECAALLAPELLKRLVGEAPLEVDGLAGTVVRSAACNGAAPTTHGS
jgi:hypothetical protein